MLILFNFLTQKSHLSALGSRAQNKWPRVLVDYCGTVCFISQWDKFDILWDSQFGKDAFSTTCIKLYIQER